MKFAISTHWNAHRHKDGLSMVKEVLDLGLTSIELGYNTHPHMLNGVEEAVKNGDIEVGSLHNFCPVPLGAQGHPEIFLLASMNKREREQAVYHTTKTIETAAKLNARTIVVHTGRVKTAFISTYDLIRLASSDMKNTKKYEKLKFKLIAKRDKNAQKYLNVLFPVLEELIPVLEKYDITIGLEILPTWDVIPTETEIHKIINHFRSDKIRCWYDTGHVQIRENLGLVNQRGILPDLAPIIAGYHLQDVEYIGDDHMAPGEGNIDFSIYKPYIENRHLVLEPNMRVTSSQLLRAIDHLKKIWSL